MSLTSSTTSVDLATRAVTRAAATGDAHEVVEIITNALRRDLAGRRAAAVLFFASAGYAGTDLTGPLTQAFPEAVVMGCSTAGEFTDGVDGVGGVTALALPEGLVVRTAAGITRLGDDVTASTDALITELEGKLGRRLRDLDPRKHLGLVLIDGLHGAEELVNERIGVAAPVLDVVGGSAGDDLAFERTWVSLGSEVSDQGLALLILETSAPFQVIKSCSFTPTGQVLQITRADVPNRTVLEFNGKSALDVYAKALGKAPEEVGQGEFIAHPVGLMIDGHPWIRSPQQVTPEGGLKFYAQILEGMEVELMQSGDLAAETAAAIQEARASLGGQASGAVMFNCILRRLEMDQKQQHAQFLAAFGGIPMAGFHTYGETWLGHINQTLTGVVFG